MPDDLLDADDEARKLSDELGALNDLLAGTAAVDPPPNLVGEVMARVRSSTAHAPVPFSDRRTERERKRSLAIRFGLGLAAALAIVFFMVPSLQESIDPRDAGGTMIGPPEETAAAREIPIRGVSFSGSIRVTNESDRVLLGIVFDSAAEREVRVRFDPAVLSVVSPAGTGDASIGPAGAGSRVFALREGATVVELSRSSAQATQIAISILQGDEVVETNVTLAKPANF